ncbi:MAG: 50S ribosomal protein L25 [Chloroflexi bacterium]|nr:50S ribosomal protein L25 [Chloroflexota bacterium]MBI3733082.1 50S ribosomal protein L25 [Chloroflexota bacterium]
MADIILNAEPRTVIGKQVKALRNKGLVPVIVYGRQREHPLSLQVEDKALRKTLKLAGGHRLINLQVNGSSIMSVARDVQQSPITRAILHADFQEVSMTEKIVLSVPLRFAGESPAVKTGLGLLIRSRESVQIEALPGDLIDSIIVDISPLAAPGQAIHVSDLKVSNRVRIVTPMAETVALMVAVKEEVLTEAAVEEVSAEVEVIKKEKAPDEEAEETE